MYTFQINSHINENGLLTLALPKEFAKQDVNIVLVIELLTQTKQEIINDVIQRKERLKIALENAVALNIFDGIDGIAWQNEQRQDRIIDCEK